MDGIKRVRQGFIKENNMENKIKITKDLKFGYEDLIKEIDVSQEFTLRDVLIACMNSKIPIETLSLLLHCSYIRDYITEASSKDFTDEYDLDYLEVYWWGTEELKVRPKGIKECGSMWCFHGIGKLGYIPDDILQYSELTEKEKKEYRQPMAIEFSSMYKLADYPIKIRQTMNITNYNKDPQDADTIIDFQPSITLIELLYAIFYELSFCGSPEQRDKKIVCLNQLASDVKSGKVKTYSSEEVFKRLKKKIKNIKKSKKGKR